MLHLWPHFQRGVLVETVPGLLQGSKHSSHDTEQTVEGQLCRAGRENSQVSAFLLSCYRKTTVPLVNGFYFRGLISRYLYENKTRKFVDVLQRILDGYNSRPNKRLGGLAPDQISPANEMEVWDKIYRPILHAPSVSKKAPKFKRYDLVKLRADRLTFGNPSHKGYTTRWSRETFYVLQHSTKSRGGQHRYLIADLAGKLVSRSGYYENQLLSLGRSYKTLAKDL